MAYVRQAVVVVHGMGEQRPLDTLNGFVDTALAPIDGEARFYSRPESVTGSYEQRRFLAPQVTSEDGSRSRPHTEFFEYHWAHLMQGNRIDDLWPTLRRMLLLLPWKVPYGLRVVWGLLWVVVVASAWALWRGPGADLFDGGAGAADTVVRTLLGTGAVATVTTIVVSRILPGALTNSFVDVVRYLDASPRSYAVRHEIRKGFVELLQALHDAVGPYGRKRYDRIVIVAHSLGAYIAYDGISHLWGTMNHLHDGGGPVDLGGLRELEEAASALPDPPGTATAAQVDAYQRAQHQLWEGVRAQGNPWRITDLVTAGTPMYFAHRLYTKNTSQFRQRVERRELPTCPPHDEEDPANNVHGTTRFYSWERKTLRTVDGKRKRVARRVLYEGAPFAVVRWTNVYFPTRAWFFGDWFGGPLAPLFGTGIRDVAVRGNTRPRRAWPPGEWFRSRFVPGWAHALYFRFADDDGPTSVTTALRDAMALEVVPETGDVVDLDEQAEATVLDDVPHP